MKDIHELFGVIESRLLKYNSNQLHRYKNIDIINCFDNIQNYSAKFSPDEVLKKIFFLKKLIAIIVDKGDMITRNVTTDNLHSMEDIDEYFKYQKLIFKSIKAEISQINIFLDSMIEIQNIRRTGELNSKKNNNENLVLNINEREDVIQENIKISIEHFKIFKNGRYKGKKIMSREEYDLLINYLKRLVSNKSVSIVKKIPKINLTNKFISYHFYILHRKLYGTNTIKDNWIDFIKNVFHQFHDCSLKTLKTKFSTPPDLYEKDIEDMKLVK